MKKALITLLLSSIFATSLSVQSDETFMSESTETSTSKRVMHTFSMQGYTGVFNTPNASVIEHENGLFSYSDNFYIRGGLISASDVKFGIGLMPGLELVGRLATRKWHCNLYTDIRPECGGPRDLSASIKYTLPLIPEDWFTVAIGGQDLGGAAVNSQAFYAVASKDIDLQQLGLLKLSAGIATSDYLSDYMNGAIASVEYQPFEFLQIATEHDGHALNAGFKFITPQTWLPAGWQVSAALQLYSSESDLDEKNNWFSLNVNVPLGDISEYKSTQAINNDIHSNAISDAGTTTSNHSFVKVAPNDDRVGIDKSITRQAPQTDATLALSQVTSETLTAFAEYVTEYGFESVSIRLADKHTGLVIQFENNLYNRNEDQAIAVMSRLITERLHVNTQLQLLNFGLIVKTIDLEYAQPGVISLDNVTPQAPDNILLDWLDFTDEQWLVNNKSSAYFVPRITVAPAISSLVGTEYGSFDFQLLASLNYQMSLWPGAVIDIRYMSDTLLHTEDFEDGRYIHERFAIPEGVNRKLFHQAFVLPFNIATQFSFGEAFNMTDVLINETRFQSDDGAHRLTFLGGQLTETLTVKRLFYYTQVNQYEPKLLKYRYRFTPLNWDIEVTAGEFLQGDTGFKVKSSHWFGDTQININYRRTDFKDDRNREETEFVSLGISIPLNLNRSMHSNYGFQVKGIEQWSYNVETVLTTPGNPNSLTTGFGQEPSLYHNLNQAYFNRDRH